MTIRGDVKGLQLKLQAAGYQAKKVAEDYEKQLLSLQGQLQTQTQKVTSLDNHLETLRQSEEMSRRELDKVKTETKLLSEKYSNQSGAYAKAAEVCHKLELFSHHVLTVLDRSSSSGRRKLVRSMAKFVLCRRRSRISRKNSIVPLSSRIAFKSNMGLSSLSSVCSLITQPYIFCY